MLSEQLHPSTIQAVLKQQEHRASWQNNDTPESLEAMIIQECEIELEEAVMLCQIGAPPEFLLSELGDGIYLGIRYTSICPDRPLSPRAGAALARCYDLCEELQINPNHLALMKVLRNDIKYPHSISNNGFNLAEGKALSKSIYASLTNGRGDYAFYALWEEYGETICHDIPETDQQRRQSAV